MLSNIKIVKKLGIGEFGVAYIAKYTNNNKKLVYKSQKVLEKTIHEDIDNSNTDDNCIREIQFGKLISGLKSDAKLIFTELIDYEFLKCKKIPGLTRQQQNDFINNKESDIEGLDEYRKKLLNSEYCFCTLYEYAGTPYSDIEYNLSIKERISICIQLIYGLAAIHKLGWIHGDIHRSNICISEVNPIMDLLIENEDKKIITLPIYGKLSKLIDYGFVKNISTHTDSELENILDREYKDDYTQADDLRETINILSVRSNIKKLTKKNKLIIDDDSLYTTFKSSPKEIMKIDKLLGTYSEHPSISLNDKYILFSLIYPDEWLNISQNENKKIKLNLQELIPTEDFVQIYIYAILNQPYMIINHLINMLSQS